MVQLFTPLVELDDISLLGSKFASSFSQSELVKPISSEHLHIDNDRQTVYWIRSGAVIRKFSYESKDMVLAAEFATFRKNDGVDSGSKDPISAVIFLPDVAHIYQQDGISYSTSMPFITKRVFPFERGLIVERKLESVMPSPVSPNLPKKQQNHPNYPKFFTLTDPILDLGLVVSSSISAIAPEEELVYFARNSQSSICVTFIQNDTPSLSSLIIYHIRHLTRNKPRPVMSSTPGSISKRKSSLKRRSSAFHHGISDQETKQRDLRDSFGTPGGTASSSADQRSSMFRLEIPPVAADRRTSLDPSKAEASYLVSQESQNYPFEISTLNKEIILTQITTLTINSFRDDLAIQSLVYDDNKIEVLSILNKTDNTLVNYLFRKSQGPIGVPSIENTNVLEAKSMVLISSTADEEGLILIQSPDNQLYLYNPFVNIKSLYLSIPKSWKSTIDSLIGSDRNIAKVRMTNGEYHGFFVKCEPKDDLTKKCLDGLSLILDPLSYNHFRFLWISTCSLSLSSDDDNDWYAFVAAVTCCLVDFLPTFDLNMKDVSYLNDADTNIENPWVSLMGDQQVMKEQEFISSSFAAAFKVKNSDAGSEFDFSEVRAHIILCLHIIREEFKLDINCRRQVDSIGTLLSVIVHLARWPEKWTSYYEKPSFHEVVDGK